MAQRWIKPKEYYWNFIQSLTQMCVEQAFGLLKGLEDFGEANGFGINIVS